ncbi:MAG: Inner membrane protein, KefB/KefC family, partial [uncultured Gemmatimonadetes bacterium]
DPPRVARPRGIDPRVLHRGRGPARLGRGHRVPGVAAAAAPHRGLPAGGGGDRPQRAGAGARPRAGGRGGRGGRSAPPLHHRHRVLVREAESHPAPDLRRGRAAGGAGHGRHGGAAGAVRGGMAGGGLHRVPGGALVHRHRPQASRRARRDLRGAWAGGAGAPHLPGSRHHPHGAAGAHAGRGGRAAAGDRLRPAARGGNHRRGAAGGAPGDAAAAGRRSAHLLARALSAHGGRRVLRHGVPDLAGGGEPVAGGVPCRAAGEREPLQRARPGRDPPPADPFQRHLLRFGGDAHRPGIPGAQPPPGGGGGGGGARGEVRHHGRGGARAGLPPARGRGVRAGAGAGGGVLVRAGAGGARGGAHAHGDGGDGLAGVHRHHRAPDDPHSAPGGAGHAPVRADDGAGAGRRAGAHGRGCRRFAPAAPGRPRGRGGVRRGGAQPGARAPRHGRSLPDHHPQPAGRQRRGGGGPPRAARRLQPRAHAADGGHRPRPRDGDRRRRAGDGAAHRHGGALAQPVAAHRGAHPLRRRCGAAGERGRGHGGGGGDGGRGTPIRGRAAAHGPALQRGGGAGGDRPPRLRRSRARHLRELHAAAGPGAGGHLRPGIAVRAPGAGACRAPQRPRLRGVPARRGRLGPPAHLHDLRARRLLRLVAQPPRHAPLPPDPPPRDALRRARGELGVVLRGLADSL